MNLWKRLQSYAAHPDPATAACNRIALLVAWNQPLYPLYLLWIVGGEWWMGGWTFLSTPFFLAVPAVARRDAALGRALLPATGMANGLLSAKLFGEMSGVELFLIPCGLIALLAFPDARRIKLGLIMALLLTASLHGHYGTPLGHFPADHYGQFRRLNAYSVAALSLFILWSLIRARPSAAPQ